VEKWHKFQLKIETIRPWDNFVLFYTSFVLLFFLEKRRTDAKKRTKGQRTLVFRAIFSDPNFTWIIGFVVEITKFE
jgi:hypothetical protein